MNEEEYLKKAKRTLSTKEDILLHMIIGIGGESGELLDAYKKYKFCERELDTQNIKEEIGDLLWYLVQLCEEVNYSISEAMSDNIEKLSKRFPEKFEDIIIRDKAFELSHIKGEIK